MEPPSVGVRVQEERNLSQAHMRASFFCLFRLVSWVSFIFVCVPRAFVS